MIAASITMYSRSIYDPEILLDATLDLEKILSSHNGKMVGLVKSHNLDEKTRSGMQYFQGELVIEDTLDDKGNPIKAYYVEVVNGLVPIDIGDGLFLKDLPTRPRVLSPPHN